MGDILNMVEGLINDMVSDTSHMNAPTVVKDDNEITAVSKLGKAKPVVIHENNHGNTKLVDPGLKSNNTSWNKRKDDFTNGLTIMMCGIITLIHL